MATIRLSGGDVDRLVDPGELVEEIKRVILSDARAPLRASVEEAGSWLGAMPAGGLGFFAVKIVGVYPDNPKKGLPLVRGILLLLDSSSGDILLEADAAPATGWRTATATALALRLLGYTGGGTLGLIGAGTQASYHLKVFSRLYGFDKLLVYDLAKERAERLAGEYGGRVVSRREVLVGSDVIIAATTSREPVVEGRLLKSGAVVASIGAPKPVRELDQATLERARCILVDTREGVLGEAGELEGLERLPELLELKEALQGKTCDMGDVKVYKSVGTALFDLAVAIHLYKKTMKQQ